MKSNIRLGIVSAFFVVLAASGLGQTEIYVSPTKVSLVLGYGYEPISKTGKQSLGTAIDPTPDATPVTEIDLRVIQKLEASSQYYKSSMSADGSWVGFGGETSFAQSLAQTADNKSVVIELIVRSRAHTVRAERFELKPPVIADLARGLTTNFIQKYGAVVTKQIAYGGLLRATLKLKFSSASEADEMRGAGNLSYGPVGGETSFEQVKKSIRKSTDVSIWVQTTGDDLPPFFKSLDEYEEYLEKFIQEAQDNPVPYLAICGALQEIIASDPKAGPKLNNWMELGRIGNFVNDLASRTQHLLDVEAYMRKSPLRFKNRPREGLGLKASRLQAEIAAFYRNLEYVEIEDPAKMDKCLNDLADLTDRVIKLEITPVTILKRIEFGPKLITAGRIRGMDDNLGPPPFGVDVRVSAKFDKYSSSVEITGWYQVAELDDDKTVFERRISTAIPVPEVIEDFPEGEWKLINTRDHNESPWGRHDMRSPYRKDLSDNNRPDRYWDWMELQCQFGRNHRNGDKGFSGMRMHFRRDVWINTELGRIALASE